MGLDGVELIMAVEEEFGVELSDADAGKLRTPRDLVDCVFGKIQAAQGETCRSQRAFYRLRRAICAQTGALRKTGTPATPLADLLPKDLKDPIWQVLRRTVEAEKWRWPGLVRPPGLVRALANGVCLFSIVASFVLVPRVLPSLADGLGLFGARVVVLLAAACVLGPLAALLTRPQRRYLPVKIKRVGDLARLWPSINPAAFSLTREQVAEKIRTIVQEQLGVTPEKYREDGDFVRDFGMD